MGGGRERLVSGQVSMIEVLVCGCCGAGRLQKEVVKRAFQKVRRKELNVVTMENIAGNKHGYI